MTKRPADAAYVPETAPMEQVRELLFGAQLKEMETRFQRQEERFQREIADARDALKTRLDSLENFMKSETSSLMHRLKEELAERDSVLKDEQRERQEGLKSEQRERAEGLRNEQRERTDALAQLAKDIAAMSEAFDRKLTKVSGTLDATERELRKLLLSESGTLSGKIEEKYQDALQVLASTAEQIRHDMVHRSSLSGMFTEVAVKLSGQWPSDLGHIVRDAESSSEAPRQGKPAAPQAGTAGTANG